MLVFGKADADTITAIRADIFAISNRLTAQVGEIKPSAPATHRLQLLDGFEIRISADTIGIGIELLLHGNRAAYIFDSTVAVYPEEAADVAVGVGWLEQLVDRLVEISADFVHVDAIQDPRAQLAAFPDPDRAIIIEVYRRVAALMAGTIAARPYDIHLTLPTGYWAPDIFCIDASGQKHSVEQDAQLRPLLEALPECCEMMMAKTVDGRAVDLVPLSLKPVRIE
ncbi:hypothetical protein [Sphingosinicella sp. BN140058]|uniref:hypothetical protein n=1 Tax=Sphingosinicella sp. BN140058 TaxID=1892855 RepID=UPI001013AAB7|nr:hypothetical protein [Sphingosinicella sp. BN140058]QAY80424.1 hypothetical protein ETR14_27680 [Sphingosinicella sp. BN140058]